MQALMTLVLMLQVAAALAMIGLVLVQHGKGADMGASFGSGASGSLFGATGSANFLSRSTAVAATIFFASTLALAYFGNNRGGAAAEQGSALEQAANAAAAASAASAASGASAARGSSAPAAAAASRGASGVASPAASSAVTAPAAAASGAALIPTK